MFRAFGRVTFLGNRRLSLEIAAVDSKLLTFLAKPAFVLLIEAFHVLGKKESPAVAVDSPHRLRFGKGIKMNDVAGVAGEFPIGIDDVATGFTRDSLVSVACAKRFRDVLVAFDAKELVFARFWDLLVRHDPRLASR